MTSLPTQTLPFPAPRPASQPRALSSSDNPFVEITPDFKLGILIYFVIWRFFPEIAQPFASTSDHFGLEVARSAMAICFEALVLWPILARKFGGTPVGWLHPLVLPSLIGIPIEFIKRPGTFIDPVASLGQRTIEMHALTSGQSLLLAELEVQFWWLLAVVATYVGFAVFRPRVLPPKGRTQRLSSTAVLVLFGVGVAAAVVLIAFNGGLMAHLTSLASGRFRTLSQFGLLLVPVTFLPVLCTLWYLYRPSVLRSPLFAAAFSAVVLLQFVVLGSRSGLFSSAILLLLAWMYINHRVPTLRLFAIGASAILLLGALGELRQSGLSGTVKFDSVINLGVADTIEKNQKEDELRKFYSGPVAIAVRVPERVDYLYGSTYIGGLLFFVPRSLWEDKPRGPGPTLVALLFSGMASTEGYVGKGVPAGGAGEAFFNFGYAGIVIGHLLFGAFLRWAVQLALVRRTPAVAMLTILIGTGLQAPTTTSIVPLLQKWVMLVLCVRLISRRDRG